LVLLGWMVTGLLLSKTVCFDQWRRSIPLNRSLPASWQRRCRRWLGNGRIDPESLYGPLVLWAMQQWQSPGHTLHLALDTTVLWNRFCVVVLSVVCHGRAIPLLWQTLEHPSASVSAEVVIALLQRADRLLSGFDAITVLADRAFPSGELLGWFELRSRWRYVMRLRADTWIHGTAAPMGCEGSAVASTPWPLPWIPGRAALGVRAQGQSGSGQTRWHHSRRALVPGEQPRSRPGSGLGLRAALLL